MIFTGIVIIAAFAAFVYIGSAYAADCDPFPWFNKRKVLIFSKWQDKIYKSYVDEKGNSYLYPDTKTCALKLYEDGTVKGASFIDTWEYA
jgi:hypothetical protein